MRDALGAVRVDPLGEQHQLSANMVDRLVDFSAGDLVKVLGQIEENHEFCQ